MRPRASSAASFARSALSLCAVGFVLSVGVFPAGCASQIGLDGVEYDIVPCESETDCPAPLQCRYSGEVFRCEPVPTTATKKYGDTVPNTEAGGSTCESNAQLGGVCTRKCRSSAECLSANLPVCIGRPNTKKTKQFTVCDKLTVRLPTPQPTPRAPSGRRWLPMLAFLAGTWAASCARSTHDPDDLAATAGAGGTGLAGAAGTSGSPATAGASAGGMTGGGAAGESGSGGTTGGSAGKGGSAAKGGSAGSPSKGGCVLVVNEVCPGKSNSNDADDEFVELYNDGGETCELEGWKVAYSSDSGSNPQPFWTGTSKDSVAAGDYFVIGGPDFKGSKQGSYDSGKLGKSGGGVGLLDDSDELVDGVAWSNAKASHPFAEGNPAGAIDEGSAVFRTTDGKDTDENKDDFDVGSPSPGAAN